MVGARLTRYLAGSVVREGLLVTGLLAAVFLGIDLTRSADELGGGFGLVGLLRYVLQTLPARVYDLFPFALLIGAMVAVARLNAASELVAMRASAFHRGRIVRAVLAAGLGLGLAVMLIGETVAPALDLQARIERERARSGALGSGGGQVLWIRDENLMIRAGLVWFGGDDLRFSELRIYRLGAVNRFDQIVTAATGRHDGRRWLLDSARVLDPVTGRSVPRAGTLALDSSLEPEIFRALATRPRLLPIRDIVEIQQYLVANDQDDMAYRQAFWRRALYPLNLLMMVLAGLTLLLRMGPRMAPAPGVFAAVSLGLAFLVIQRLILGLAPVLPIPMGITHLIPAGLFLGFSLWMLRR